MNDPVPTGNTYDKYGSRNPLERALVAGFLRRIDSLLPAGRVGRILEVGMGEGQVAARVRARYPSALITGIDLPDADLAAHWRHRRLPGAFANGTALPFPDRAFDLVLGIEVLEHVAQPVAVLHEIARVARGPVVLSVPSEPVWRVANMARGKYLRALGNTPGHVQHFTPGAFTRFVGEALDVVSVARPFPWTVVAAQSRAA